MSRGLLSFYAKPKCIPDSRLKFIEIWLHLKLYAVFIVYSFSLQKLIKDSLLPTIPYAGDNRLNEVSVHE